MADNLYKIVEWRILNGRNNIDLWKSEMEYYKSRLCGIRDVDSSYKAMIAVTQHAINENEDELKRQEENEFQKMEQVVRKDKEMLILLELLRRAEEKAYRSLPEKEKEMCTFAFIKRNIEDGTKDYKEYKKEGFSDEAIKLELLKAFNKNELEHKNSKVNFFMKTFGLNLEEALDYILKYSKIWNEKTVISLKIDEEYKKQQERIKKYEEDKKMSDSFKNFLKERE